jgi:hypothetical protein
MSLLGLSNLLKGKMRTVVSLFTALAAVLAVGCKSSPPYRTSLLDLSKEERCQEAYERAKWTAVGDPAGQDAETRKIQDQIKTDRKSRALADCWNTSREHHPTFDLYFVEFDDQGWLAGKVNSHGAADTQLTTLVNDLEAKAHGGGGRDPRPLSIIIYTHGWHHSAAPDDTNVIAFRRLLDSASEVEHLLCLASSADRVQGVPACTDAESGGRQPKKRRVVGIYVGWRGDSVIGPLIDNTSIWDRKHAAETIALGSVQEFFARMHNFYVAHACHLRSTSDRDPARCQADVRMLTIGHSFGGLITYRALAPRMMLGIAETTYVAREETKQRYAYGFGDLTVLINPAFEATRFEPLAEVAASRSYETADSGKSQLPVLIVATSETDDATGIFFPLFRWVTTRFERVVGVERTANVRTIGWDRRYQTHSLTFQNDSDACQLAKRATLQQRLAAESDWSDRQRQENYLMFDAPVLDLCDGLRLTKDMKQAWQLERPRFMPLWVVKADKSVINGHNDFLNPRFVDFIRQVYYTILREGDLQLNIGPRPGK